MDERLYEGSAIQSLRETKQRLATMAEARPDDSTLRMVSQHIIDHMQFSKDALGSWYKDGVEDRWDANTISVGKAACMGRIDSLGLLALDMERGFKELQAVSELDGKAERKPSVLTKLQEAKEQQPKTPPGKPKNAPER